jgi:hypothetical protein
LTTLASRLARARFGSWACPRATSFPTLIADIVDVSTANVSLSETTQTELRGLEQDLHLQVFVTPT